MSDRLRKRRQLLVLRAFFDESGTDPKANKALIMGGFLGKVEEWERASDAWDRCLQEQPSIAYFKSSEAKSLDGQFLRFNRESADAKVDALASIITNFKLLGFCASVSYTWFMYRDAKASRGQVGARVYDWGFSTATSGVLQYLDYEAPGDEKVDFVFDRRSELNACIAIYNQMKASPLLKSKMRHAGECFPGDDKEIAALQMADLLAGESCSAMDTKVMSDVFNLIKDNNKIVHIPCEPPRQFPNSLKLQKIARQVHKEAIDFLRRVKKGSPDRFSSVEEAEKHVNDLNANEAYFYLELQRHLAQLDEDKDYQEFRKKLLAAYEPDEGNEN